MEVSIDAARDAQIDRSSKVGGPGGDRIWGKERQWAA